MNYPIKVLILDTVMDRGGAETMTMNYFRHIDRGKVSFDFLVHRDYKAAYEDEIEALGGRIYRICPPYPQHYFKYVREISSFFKAHPEYKIIHSNMMEIAYPAYKAAQECGVPVRICHAHTCSPHEQLTPKTMIRRIYKKAMRPYITHRFACGQNAAKYVFGSTDHVIYMRNAVDAEQFSFDAAVRDSVRGEFNLHGKYVVGHVGRFFTPKNHTFLIDIFAEIARRDPDAVLMLVGGGELDDALMNRIKEKVNRLGLADRVIFTGVRADVNRILQAFDVFVLPSLCEGLPVVMIEAQAAGLPCVMSDRVTDECVLTDDVKTLSLTDHAEEWADVILQFKGSFRRKNMYETIAASGYDIHSNAGWMENFYIGQFQKYTVGE